ncbi:MAG: TadE/TadG family type IV pilus assembly protein [Candidatus Dormibacteria bacterium]
MTRWSSCATRCRTSGLAAVEMALLLPVLLALVSAAIVAGQLITTNIGLASAARAGAAAAALDVQSGNIATEAADAANAARQEEGGTLNCQAGGSVPASCVSLTTTTGSSSGIQIEVVVVYGTVTPYLTGVAPITVQANAAASP